MKLKPVAFLLGLHFAAPALAIGLGDLSVQSSLGQPLHATIEVLNAPAALDAECLGLRSSDNNLPAPAQTRLRVERRGDNALLHITTARAVDDPVAQFVLTSDCDGRVEREYVLLLDPPTQIESTAPAEPQAASGSAATNMPAATAASSSGPVMKSAASKPRASRTLPRRTGPAKPAAVSVEPVAAAKTQAPSLQSERAAPVHPKTATAAPRLVISGKRAVSQSGSLPAGQEKDGASPNPLNPRSTSLSSTELSDENTALNHRLAHLESQIAALHKRNAELEAQLSAPALATALPQPVAPQTSPWPLYLIGAGLFTLSGVLLAGMWRRRELPPRAEADAASWTRPLDAMPARTHTTAASTLPRSGSLLQNNSAARPPEDQDIAELPLSTLAKRTEVKEDILNQAEVFVAHGYINMAINLLQEYLHEVPAASPVPWLLLLDLLQHSGDTAGYAAASAECRRHFNVNFPTRPRSQDQDDSGGLENYPHILDMLTQSWNTPEISAIFKDLIYDQRNGVRMGFAPDAYRDILLLNSIAQDKALLAT